MLDYPDSLPYPLFPMKKIFFLTLSGFVSGALVYYLITRSQWADWQRIGFQLNPVYLTWYLSLYGGGLLARTFRYQLLLKSARSQNLPSFGGLFLVTSVRNMLVDFLPARTGSLSYIVLLNKAFKVDLSPCLTSFAYSFLFDLLAMGPLLAMALLAEGLTSNKNYPWLWGIAVFILLAALGVILSLGPLVELFSRWFSRNGYRWKRYPRIRNLEHHLQLLAQSFSMLKQSRVFWPTLGLSILIRVIKYLSLYLLLSAVLQALNGVGFHLPFWVVLLGLVGSEAAAGLPVSGLAGFGFYEGVLGAVLSTQGIDSSQSLLVAFAMHLLTQVVDYSLGGGALLYIVIRWGGLKKKDRMSSS